MDSTNVKLAAVGMPLGWETKRTSRLLVGLFMVSANGFGELVRAKGGPAWLWLSPANSSSRLRPPFSISVFNRLPDVTPSNSSGDSIVLELAAGESPSAAKWGACLVLADDRYKVIEIG